MRQNKKKGNKSMSVLGLGNNDKDSKKKDSSKKKEDNSSQSDEAKAILEKMEAKKDAGDCPFC